ncbi:Ldh family oxidoreductase [Ensifer adhaerens]|uniref:Ldh family oxidoreductase n=1 Tax=Ensifer adhaerens TaxID=106592 RepID=UPI0023A9F82F|nr:Ldh family oxidoreductase [Ensifer adhaerens]WDZ78989.1 Ldh family oxidoreductase [Ensifer adhaerens]
MPDQLRKIGETILAGAGVPIQEAQTIARHLVGANLAGHDSHGIIQIPTYIDRMKAGHIVPGAKWNIVQESATTTVIDGHWGFGYVVNERAMQITIDKAEKSNVAAATVFRQGHIGRLAAYPLMAAERGMIGLIAADSGRSPKAVAPYGGAEARLGTNPLAIAVPSELDGPMFIDMSTAAVSMGKVKLAAARGRAIPEGWVVDKDGAATTDPQSLFQGGSLLPLGGSEGYKGYGLAVMVEILCGLLTGLGFGVEPTGRHNDGCFMAVFKVDAFRPLAQFRQEVADLAHFLKDTKPSHGSDGVLYPGEIENRNERRRSQAGIEIEAATWQKLQALAESYGVADQMALA